MGTSSQREDGAARHNQFLMKLYVFLWERHLAATSSWLEATPTRLKLRYR